MKSTIPPCDICHRRYGVGMIRQNGKTYRACLHCQKLILESKWKRNHAK